MRSPPGDRDHAGARGHGELDGGRSDAARRGLHQHGLAGLQTSPFVQSEPGEVEREEERRGVRTGQRSRRVEGHVGRAGDQLGVRSEGTRGGRDDTSALPVLLAGPRGFHHARQLHAQRVRERRVDREVPPVAAVDLVVVEDAGTGAHEHLAGPRNGLGNLVELECVRWSAEPVHPPRTHAANLPIGGVSP